MKHGGKATVSVKKQINISIPRARILRPDWRIRFQSYGFLMVEMGPGAWDLSDYTTLSLETKSKIAETACTLALFSSHSGSIITWCKTDQLPTLRDLFSLSIGHSGSVFPWRYLVSKAMHPQNGLVFCPLLILSRNTREDSVDLKNNQNLKIELCFIQGQFFRTLSPGDSISSSSERIAPRRPGCRQGWWWRSQVI